MPATIKSVTEIILAFVTKAAMRCSELEWPSWADLEP